jgi:uroporphyrinogen-III synthase
MSSDPLRGFTVAITADRRAEEQAELIRRRGGEVLLGPVIRTLPLGGEPDLAAATSAVIADPPDVVVLSTALGVRGWCSSAEALDRLEDLQTALAGARVLARGPKAAGAAHSFGIEVAWQAPGATYVEIVEELRRAPTTRPDGTPVRLALQRDGERDSQLAATLGEIGFDVITVPVYEWLLPLDPVPARRLVTAVAERSVDAVTFTSAHAVSNFGSIASSTGQLDAVVDSLGSGQVTAVCVGPVTASRVRALGVERCIEPRNARLGAMVQAMALAFAGRSVELDLQGLIVRMQGRFVAVGDAEPVRLPERERAVLEALTRQPGTVWSKQALLREVWREESDDHVVEVTVGRLRRRLGSAGGSIETVMRRGYRIAIN